MNKLDKDYQSLLQDILDNGVKKKIEPEPVLNLYSVHKSDIAWQMDFLFLQQRRWQLKL